MKRDNIKWFPIPPYNANETWKIVNERCELIATFETKEECITAAEAVNSYLQVAILTTPTGDK